MIGSPFDPDCNGQLAWHAGQLENKKTEKAGLESRVDAKRRFAEDAGGRRSAARGGGASGGAIIFRREHQGSCLDEDAVVSPAARVDRFGA